MAVAGILEKSADKLMGKEHCSVQCIPKNRSCACPVVFIRVRSLIAINSPVSNQSVKQHGSAYSENCQNQDAAPVYRDEPEGADYFNGD